jgi:hypothetical protein
MIKGLRTDVELLAAALFQRPVTVWLHRGLGDNYGDIPLDKGGIIEQITPVSVRIRCIDGSKMYYSRDNVEFRV